MVAVFARKIDGNLTSLVKKIDETAAKGKQKVFTTLVGGDADANESKLKELEKESGVKTPLCLFEDESGPKSYKLSKDAEVTVVMYNKRKVVFTKAMKLADLNEDAVKKLIEQMKKLSS